MQSQVITTARQRNEVFVSEDLADEALALAQRVNRKIHQTTPIVAQPLVEDEYEPHTIGKNTHHSEPRMSKRTAR